MILTNNNMALYRNPQNINNLKPDFQIILNGQKYDVERKKLIKGSLYFSKICETGVDSATITQNFKPKTFQNILYALLFETLPIQRQQIEENFKIATFLQSKNVISLIMKDIMNNFNKYSLFKLISSAHTYNNQELFQKCMQQLQKQSYKHIQQNQLQLISLSLPLFKLVLQSHNRFKKYNKTVIPYTEINRILIQFCNKNQLTKRQYIHLKFQLFDITALNAQEYSNIFIDEIMNEVQCSSVNNIKLKESLSLQGVNQLSKTLFQKDNKLSKTQSQFSPLKKIGKNSEILVTFLMKKIEFLQKENGYLENQLQKIKNMTMENQKIHSKMQQQIMMLISQIKQKQKKQRESRNTLKNFEPLLTKLQVQIQKKSKQIDQLRNMYEKSKGQKQQKKMPEIKTQLKNQEPEGIIQSQFLSANFLQQMFSNFSLHKTPAPKKSITKEVVKAPIVQISTTPKMMDSEDQQEHYVNRLEFDKQSICVTKNLLPKLSSILTDGFLKKKLHLIYRRSHKSQYFGKKQDLFNKNALVLFIKTDLNNIIGGYISQTIPSTNNSKIRDNYSYLFNLSQNLKLSVKRNCKQSIINCEQNNLISFSQDLIIPKDCLKQKSKCRKPLSYEYNQKNSINPNWAGGQQFLIKDIEIYQVIQAEMQMIL